MHLIGTLNKAKEVEIALYVMLFLLTKISMSYFLSLFLLVQSFLFRIFTSELFLTN